MKQRRQRSILGALWAWAAGGCVIVAAGCAIPDRRIDSPNAGEDKPMGGVSREASIDAGPKSSQAVFRSKNSRNERNNPSDIRNKGAGTSHIKRDNEWPFSLEPIGKPPSIDVAGILYDPKKGRQIWNDGSNPKISTRYNDLTPMVQFKIKSSSSLAYVSIVASDKRKNLLIPLHHKEIDHFMSVNGLTIFPSPGKRYPILGDLGATKKIMVIIAKTLQARAKAKTLLSKYRPKEPDENFPPHLKPAPLKFPEGLGWFQHPEIPDLVVYVIEGSFVE